MINTEQIKNDEKEMNIMESLNAESEDPKYNGMSTLHFFAMDDDPLIIRLAIKSGVDVDKTDKEGNTALFYCCNKSNAHALIEGGINPNILNDDGETAVATMPKENRNLVKYLAQVTDLDLHGPNRMTLLQKLIHLRNRDYDLIGFVLSRTKNKDILFNSETLLFQAARTKNYEDIIFLLAKSGMNLHIRNRYGKDFYDYCFKNVQKEIREQMPEFMEERKLHNECNKYNI